MTLPILLSVPHAGLAVPDKVRSLCRLTREEIVADGDEGAAEIYDLQDEVQLFITTDVARAVVDLNRAEDDFRPDGVLKTQTVFEVPIWREPLQQEKQRHLLAEYYHPYHRRLSEAAGREDLLLAVDCHTMLAVGPPIGPGPGIERPWVCLGDVDGQTLPAGWMDRLAAGFGRQFGDEHVRVNDPFRGGYITRTHGQEMPWVQLELSRGPFLSNAQKRERVRKALREFVTQIGAQRHESE